MKTRTLLPVNRLAVLLALPLAALAGGCGAGADREPPSGPAAAITTATDPVPSVTDPLSAPEASPDPAATASPAAPAAAGSAAPPAVTARSAGTITDLDQLDTDLAELDAHLSEADRDLATPEGDF